MGEPVKRAVGGLMALSLGIVFWMLLRAGIPRMGGLSPVSPLATMQPHASPMPTSSPDWRCTPPPFPTPPFLVCLGLPTPTPRATRAAESTPWIPPYPGEIVSIPTRMAAADARGWVIIPNLREGALAIRTDGAGRLLSDRTRLRLVMGGEERPAIFQRLIPSPNARYLAGMIEVESGDLVYFLEWPRGRVKSWVLSDGWFLQWHPDGRRALLANTMDGVLLLFDVEKGERRVVAKPALRDVAGAAISPDGQWLAYGTNTGDAHEIWVARGDGKEPRLLLRTRGMAVVWG